MMYRDSGSCVRMAFDPERIDEAAALALLYVRVPRLVDELGLCRAGRQSPAKSRTTGYESRSPGLSRWWAVRARSAPADAP